MKKVLVIANLFHASPRIPGLTTYLPEFGWSPTIVTPPLTPETDEKFGFPKNFRSNVKLIEIPYKGDVLWFWRKLFQELGFRKDKSLTEQIKEVAGVSSRKSFIEKLLYFYEAVFGYPDTEKFWIKPVLTRLEPLLERERYDVLISSSPYPTNHIIASRLKEKFDIPWLADFRDPWTQNHNYVYGSIRKWFDIRLEKRTLQNADLMTAASPSYAKKQEGLHQKRTLVLTNGFDPEMMVETQTSLTKKFTVTYTGTIYPEKQDPTKLFTALRDLIAEGVINPQRIEVRFYGGKLPWLDTEITKYGLADIVRQYGVVSKQEVLRRQRESHLLLLFGWEDNKETGVYPLKTFEYLAARRPILVTGGLPEEDIKRVIAETDAGQGVVTKEEIKSALATFYREYMKNGEVSYHGNLERINGYSYRNLASRLAMVLEKVSIPSATSHPKSPRPLSL